MYLYDRANLLASEIRSSEEYKAYKTAKDAVYEDASAKQLIAQYKKLQFSAQATVLSGGQPDSATMDQLQKLGELLAYNPKAAAFFEAEYKFNTIIGDIYKIIGDAAEIDTNFMME